MPQISRDRPPPGRARSGDGAFASGQNPARPREVARVAVRVTLEVVLVLGLSLPEGAGGGHLGDDPPGPKPGCLYVGDGVLGYPTLLVVQVENRRAIAGAPVVPLAVERGWVVDLEEKLEDVAIGGQLGVKDDFDGFGVGAVVAVRGVRDITPAVAHPGRDDAGAPADKVLHPPEAPTGEDRLLGPLAH